jgi:hypothetical protein
MHNQSKEHRLTYTEAAGLARRTRHPPPVGTCAAGCLGAGAEAGMTDDKPIQLRPPLKVELDPPGAKPPPTRPRSATLLAGILALLCAGVVHAEAPDLMEGLHLPATISDLRKRLGAEDSFDAKPLPHYHWDGASFQGTRDTLDAWTRPKDLVQIDRIQDSRRRRLDG